MTGGLQLSGHDRSHNFGAAACTIFSVSDPDLSDDVVREDNIDIMISGHGPWGQCGGVGTVRTPPRTQGRALAAARVAAAGAHGGRSTPPRRLNRCRRRPHPAHALRTAPYTWRAAYRSGYTASDVN